MIEPINQAIEMEKLCEIYPIIKGPNRLPICKKNNSKDNKVDK